MSVIIGVDPSSRAMHGVATGNDGDPVVFVRPLNKQDKPLACGQSFTWMYEAVKQVKAEYVFIEVPVMGRAGAHTMLVISQVVGAAAAGAVLAGAKVTFVNNQRWKKQVVGKGNASKPEIKAWVKENWPWLYAECDGQQDTCDAGCITVYGEKVIGISRRVVRPKKRIVRRSR